MTVRGLLRRFPESDPAGLRRRPPGPPPDGASRAACDLGWYPPSQQVGLTGKTVSPELYIAVAISGASQHMSGMAGSKNIVAINKDADSNMVKSSRYAVIGDYKQVLPALIAEVKKLKS